MDAAIVRDIDQDHMTYLVVFQSANDTDAKMIAIELRNRAYVESGQSRKWQEQQWAGGQAAANQMLNASIQQNTQNTI